MDVFEIIAVLLTFTAMGAYLNVRFFKLPATIGMMFFALLMSLLSIALNATGLVSMQAASALVAQIDFSNLVLHGMLSFLLFAGALHINLNDLRKYQVVVTTLATLGVVIATFATGTLVWLASQALGADIPYIYALLFGALISPTDPVAVLGILKEAGLSKSLRIKIGCESLFNDGVGVVMFLLLLGIATQPQLDLGIVNMLTLLVWPAAGSLALGFALGWCVLKLLETVDDYKVEAMLTLGLVSGGYGLAEAVHVSAPITMVVAGLVIGNHGRTFGMSERSRKNLDLFWELLDEILNAILFMLVGLVIMIVPFRSLYLAMGLVAILAVLAGRWISVALPIAVLRHRYQFGRGTVTLLTWGGLRGGISIAMVLSLPTGVLKDLLLSMTYMVVVFSVLFQGTTFRPVAQMLTQKAKEASKNDK